MLHWRGNSSRAETGFVIPSAVPKRACVCAHCSCMQCCATQGAAARQAPLSMAFSRQEYWSGLPCLLQGIFPTQESTLFLLHLPALAGRLFTTRASWEAHVGTGTQNLQGRWMAMESSSGSLYVLMVFICLLACLLACLRVFVVLYWVFLV